MVTVAVVVIAMVTVVVIVMVTVAVVVVAMVTVAVVISWRCLCVVGGCRGGRKVTRFSSGFGVQVSGRECVGERREEQTHTCHFLCLQ